MKKAILYTLIGGVLCIGQTPVAHAASDLPQPANILISEVQTGGASDTTEEFVELFNPNDAPVDITGWQLQYRAASATATQSWPASTVKVTFACPTGSATDCRVIIAPHNRIVATHTLANIAGAFSMAGGFSGTGGQIRLVQPGNQPTVHDLVGYGTAVFAETNPAPAPTGGTSVKRAADVNDDPIDTNNNAIDFIAACGEPTPGQDDIAFLPRATGCQEPEPTPTPGPQPGDLDPGPSDQPSTDEPGQGGVTDPTPTYLPLIITEVFADPESPQQDSTDEFIEIYNPNDSAVTLKDYRLQTGSDYRYSFTLGDTPLGPHMYLAIPSAVSKLSLANSGSGVRLIDPLGNTAYEAPNYGDAKEGQSWMQDDAGWKWSLTPTPGAANVLTLPKPKATAAAIPAPAKKKTATKTSTSKTTSQKAAKAPAAKKSTEKTPQQKTPTTKAAATFNPQYWLLAPLGTLAVGYAAYEYRHGISRTARTSWAKIRGKQPPAKDQ